MDFERIRQNKTAIKLFNILGFLLIILSVVAAIIKSERWDKALIFSAIIFVSIIIIAVISNNKRDAIAIRYAMMISFLFFYSKGRLYYD